jgi:hypothetical protein
MKMVHNAENYDNSAKKNINEINADIRPSRFDMLKKNNRT